MYHLSNKINVKNMRMITKLTNIEANGYIDILTRGGLTSYSSNEIAIFEKELIEHFSFDDCVATSSGTASLMFVFFQESIKSGDHVLVPSFGYPASILPALHVKADIEFYDIDRETYGPDYNDLTKRITDRTKIIVVAHLFGIPTDMSKMGLPGSTILVEDCAQALGATVNGESVGKQGEYGCFSFQETKLLSCAEGGAIVSSRDNVKMARQSILGGTEILAKRINSKDTESWHRPGFNFKFDALRARLGRIQLKSITTRLEVRRKIARFYERELSGKISAEISHSIVRKNCSPHAFPLLVGTDKRDSIINLARQEGLLIRSICPKPLWELDIVKDSVVPNSQQLPDISQLVKQNIQLPVHSSMSEVECQRVVEFIIRNLK